MNHNPMNLSLSRFQESTLPFETAELSEEQVNEIHSYIEQELEEELELPTIDRIMVVFNLHEDYHDEAENILMQYDGEI